MHSISYINISQCILALLLFVAAMLTPGIIGASNGDAYFVTETDQPVFDSGWSETVAPPEKFRFSREHPQAYSHGKPTNAEQLMLELVNASRADPEEAAQNYGIDLNDGLPEDGEPISSSPKQPLAFNPALIAAALGHSQWMLDTDTFSHTGQDGSTHRDRMEAAGYVFSDSCSSGENIGWSGTTGNMDEEYHAREVIEILFGSFRHRKNTLAESFSEIGIGGLTGSFIHEDIEYNALMVTEKFAHSSSTPTPMLVGVVYEDSNGNDKYDMGEGLSGVRITLDAGAYYAVTSGSGGYAVPLPDREDGTLDVSAYGGGFSHPVTKQISLTGKNVKLDFALSDLEPIIYTINLSSSPVEGGDVTGGGEYEQWAEVTVKAIPGQGWVFAGWTENGAFLSSDAEYSFLVDADRSLTANFRRPGLPGVMMLLLEDE